MLQILSMQIMMWFLDTRFKKGFREGAFQKDKSLSICEIFPYQY